MRQIVRCNWCGWIGYEDEFEDHSKDPSCHKRDSMSKIDHHCGFGDDRKIEQLWDLLEDVPFNEDKNGELILAEEWFGFPKGTERTEIWKWFDSHYSNGIFDLMYGREA